MNNLKALFFFIKIKIFSNEFSIKYPFFYLIIYIIFFTKCNIDTQHNNSSQNIFRFNYYSEVSSLDPAFARTQANIWVINQLFNGLVQLNEKLEILPCIAQHWEISEDGTIYTFFLRNDIFFHDSKIFPEGKGRKVNAKDFAYSFNRIIDSKTASPGSWIFSDKVDKTDPFSAIDDTTFRIKLQHPFPPFLGILSMQYCSVVPKEGVDFFQNDFGRNPIGTGPFKFSVWQQGISLSLVKNQNYFESAKDGIQLPYLDGVQISFLDNRSAEFLKFIKGDLDFVSTIDGSFKDEVLTPKGELQPKYKGKIKFSRTPNLNIHYLGFLMDTSNNIMKNNPLKIKAVRQAINYGFDREKMMKYLYNSIGMPSRGGIIPPGLPSYSTNRMKSYFYSPEKAMKLLKDAGFPNGKGLPPIKLYFTNNYTNHVTYIQNQLSALGIHIELETVVPAFLRETMSKYQISFFSGNWIADYPDEENFMTLFYGKNSAPPNYTHFQSELFNQLYEASLDETNLQKRIKYYQQMDSIIIDEAPVVSLFYDEVVIFTQNNIEGLEPNPLNLLVLKKVRKTSRPERK